MRAIIITMKTTIPFYVVLFLALFVSACGSRGVADIRDELGFKKKSPDEFRVVKRAPLEVPPEYRIRPPEPGAERPQEPPPRERALITLTGDNNETDDLSQGESILLQQAGVTKAPEDIRTIVDEETATTYTKPASVAERLGIVSRRASEGEVIDPREEAEKLKEEGRVKKVVHPVYDDDVHVQP